MKTIKFIICSILVISIFGVWSACNTSEDVVSKKISDKQVLAELDMSLDSLINEFTKEYPPTPASRFLGFRDFWKAVRADFYSTAIMNPYTGQLQQHNHFEIATSKECWKKRNQNKPNYTPQQIQELDSMLQEMKITLQQTPDDIGAIHNIAIIELIVNNEDNYESTAELMIAIDNKLKQYGIETGVTDFSAAANIVDDFIDNVYDDSDDVMYERLISRYSDKKDELSILHKYFTTASKYAEPSEIRLFTIKFREELKERVFELDPRILRPIEDCLDLAPKSYDLWSTLGK